MNAERGRLLGFNRGRRDRWRVVQKFMVDTQLKLPMGGEKGRFTVLTPHPDGHNNGINEILKDARTEQLKAGGWIGGEQLAVAGDPNS